MSHLQDSHEKGRRQVGSTIRLHDFQLSFIWAQAVPDLFGTPKPVGPLGFIGVGDQYRRQFDLLQRALLAPGGVARGADATWPGLQVPWRSPSGQHFWTYYFERRTREDIRSPLDPQDKELREFLRAQERGLVLVRKAATMPQCSFDRD